MTGTSWTIAEYDALAPMPAGRITAPLPVVPIIALAPIAENMQADIVAAIVAVPVTVPAATIEEEETIPAAAIEGDGTEATIEEGGTDAL